MSEDVDIRSFFVPGKIRGKGRPRFTSVGKFGRAYTPKETVHYEALIRLEYQRKYGLMPPMDGPLSLVVVCWFPIPASWPKKKRSEALMYTGKPDGDNIIKAVGDALNCVAFADDSQIADVRCIRLYSGDRAGNAVPAHNGISVTLKTADALGIMAWVEKKEAVK